MLISWKHLLIDKPAPNKLINPTFSLTKSIVTTTYSIIISVANSNKDTLYSSGSFAVVEGYTKLAVSQQG